jgi:anaerobic selenocysteine-containing dehydrogenase
MDGSEHRINTSPIVSDKVDTTTCYMCACRCGIKVHLLDGKIRYIEGNPDHPVNKGVLCAKGSAGIMQHYSPARLSKPLRGAVRQMQTRLSMAIISQFYAAQSCCHSIRAASR